MGTHAPPALHLLQYLRRLESRFGGPPWGYAPDLVRACVLGLLRGQQCQIRLANGDRITSYRDPGVRDLFTKDRDFMQAEVGPSGEQAVKPADRIKIRLFFEECTQLEYEGNAEELADAAFVHLHRFAKEHLELLDRLQRLAPLKPKLPEALQNLESTLSKCLQSRQIEATLVAIKKHLNTLRDGIQQLGVYRGDLTDEAIEQVRRAQRLASVELDPLQQLGLDSNLEQAAQSLRDHLALNTPWRDIASIRPAMELIEARYREIRAELLEKQEQKIESHLEQIKLREGFSRLDADAADSVLRLVRDRRMASHPEAISPALIVLRDSVPRALREGLEQANQRLEELLSVKFDVQVVSVKLGLANRELTSPADVENLLQELRERLMAQLKDNSRIRLE